MTVYDSGDKKITPGCNYVEVWGVPGDDPAILKVQHVGYTDDRMKLGVDIPEDFGLVSDITPLRILDDYLINVDFDVIYGEGQVPETFSMGLNPTTNLILKKIKARQDPKGSNIYLFVIKQTNKPTIETTAIEFTYGRHIKYYHELQAIYFAYTDKILPWKSQKLSRIGSRK